MIEEIENILNQDLEQNSDRMNVPFMLMLLEKIQEELNRDPATLELACGVGTIIEQLKALRSLAGEVAKEAALEGNDTTIIRH